MDLYSYCIPIDDGAAPNPYWGTCTLAICKPAIRRTAQKGDWVVGLGSKHSRIGDVSQHVVYAMKVTQVLSMKEYDRFCRKSLAQKIPDWTNPEFPRRVGDCIYDFSHKGEPRLLPSVHSEANRRKDLSGKNVLISKHFYYFGDKPLELPSKLQPIVHATQGHKSRANREYAHAFAQWLQHTGYRRNVLLGQPQLKRRIMSMTEEELRSSCSKLHDRQDSDEMVC